MKITRKPSHTTPADLTGGAREMYGAMSPWSQAGSANDLNVYAQVIGPVRPDAISGVGRARQAAGQGQTDPIGQAEAGAVAEEGRRQASIEAAEVAHRDAEGVQLGVIDLGRHTQARGLLKNLGVVHRADRRVVGSGSSSYDVGAGLVVDEGQ